jgi:hypothetical protein
LLVAIGFIPNRFPDERAGALDLRGLFGGQTQCPPQRLNLGVVQAGFRVARHSLSQDVSRAMIAFGSPPVAGAVIMMTANTIKPIFK